MTTTTFIQQNLTANGFTKRNRKSRLFSQNLYQVDVEGEDGDHITFEVTANSYAEATAKPSTIQCVGGRPMAHRMVVERCSYMIGSANR